MPFAVEGDRSYFQRREVIEAAALVRCILDPHDHLALLAVMRSVVIGVPDAALIPLWVRGFPARASALHGAAEVELDSLRGLIGDAAKELPGDVPGIERVAGWECNLLAALRALALLRESFAQDPADRFVENLRTRFLVEATEAARYLGAYRVANLDRFFRDLLTALEDGSGDPHAVLRSLRSDVVQRREAEEGRPRESAEDAVRITTIQDTQRPVHGLAE